MITEKILFKESLFHTSYPGDLEIINKHIEHILLFDEGRYGSNEGGFQSNNISFGFKELITFMQGCVDKLGNGLVFSNFWLNINKGTHHNSEHIHELNGLSAVYYHKVCCDKCPIYFRHLCPHVVLDEASFSPKNQDIVIFPSYLPHGVKKCGHSDHERISIAFNFAFNDLLPLKLKNE